MASFNNDLAEILLSFYLLVASFNNDLAKIFPFYLRRMHPFYLRVASFNNDLAEIFPFYLRRLSSERSHRLTMLTHVDHTVAKFHPSFIKSPVVQALGQPTVPSPHRRNNIRRPRPWIRFVC